MEIAPAIERIGKEREIAKALSRGKKVSVRLARRSALVPVAAEGQEDIAIAARLAVATDWSRTFKLADDRRFAKKPEAIAGKGKVNALGTEHRARDRAGNSPGGAI